LGAFIVGAAQFGDNGHGAVLRVVPVAESAGGGDRANIWHASRGEGRGAGAASAGRAAEAAPEPTRETD
jgi:hypothetical protein